MLTALITGSNGFIGTALVKQLLEKGIKPICLVRENSTHRLPKEAQVVLIPKFTPEYIHIVLRDIQFDFVYHLASYGVLGHERDPTNTLEVNIQATASLLELAKNMKLKKFVHIGTSAEYGNPINKIPMNEQHSLQPLSIYGASKIASHVFASALAKQYNIPFVHLRLFNVYGFGEAQHRLAPYVIKKLMANEIVDLSPGEQVRDFLHIDDVVNALLIVANLPQESATYNICSGKAESVKNIPLNLVKLMNKDIKLLDFGARERRDDETLWLVGDNSKFRHDSNWEPKISLEQGLDLMINKCMEAQ